MTPRARLGREAEAVRRARKLGISAPALLDAGEHRGQAWALFERLPGAPGTLEDEEQMQAFVDRVLLLRRALEAPALQGRERSGWGWTPAQEEDLPHSSFLLAQLSERAQSRSLLRLLARELTAIDPLPGSLLHGDLKAEHFLTGPETTHMVDWEASARGPGVVDLADAAFHAVRDLVYGQRPVELSYVDAILPLGPSPPVLAWRVALWLDRRRPGDLDLFSDEEAGRIACASSLGVALRNLGRVIATARAHGVPR